MEKKKLLEFEQSVAIIKILLEEKGYLEFKFRGSSMLPTIEPGTILKVKCCDDLVIGKIYVFIDRDPDSFSKMVCHRLQKIDQSLYYFKGDNRENIDQPVERENIIGEVVYWR